MTDDEIVRTAAELCDRGADLPGEVSTPRPRKIVSEDDALQARYLIPALLELIERRGLCPAEHPGDCTCGDCACAMCGGNAMSCDGQCSRDPAP